MFISKVLPHLESHNLKEESPKWVQEVLLSCKVIRAKIKWSITPPSSVVIWSQLSVARGNMPCMEKARDGETSWRAGWQHRGGEKDWLAASASLDWAELIQAELGSWRWSRIVETRQPGSISSTEEGCPINGRHAHEFSSQWNARKHPPLQKHSVAEAAQSCLRSLINEWSCFQAASVHISALSVQLLHPLTEKTVSKDSGYKEIPALTMEGQQRNSEVHDGDTAEDVAAAIKATDSILDLHLLDSPSPSSSCSPLPPSASASALLALASPATRRSISMGDFRRVTGALLARSEPPSTSATAPSSKLVTPSSSMEFEAARRRLLEVEERQRVIREMERRLEELREMFVRSEQQVVLHGELVTRISSAAQQGELYVAENGQRLKKGLKFKKHRPTIIFSSMLGLRTCLPWPVKLK